MADEKLEKIIEQKIKPMLEKAMHQNLGITIAELESDVSDRLKKSVLLDVEIDTSLPFKQSKKKFKRQYIARLLKLNSGNIEETAKTASIDRRSVHRVVAEIKLNVAELRENKYAKQHTVRGIIENTLEHYKSSLNPMKYESFYHHAPELSKNIADQLPEEPKPLKEAEKDFEREYLQRVLHENSHNISKTARKIGLRFETLHRKLKRLGISK